MSSLFFSRLLSRPPRIIGMGTLVANGKEQTVIEYSVSLSTISGYIDLSRMTHGDEVVISLYVKLRPDKEYRLYHREIFYGAQETSALYILPRLSAAAIKVTLQQTKGKFKEFDFYFVAES